MAVGIRNILYLQKLVLTSPAAVVSRSVYSACGLKVTEFFSFAWNGTLDAQSSCL
jgi:hypothetical protein